MVDDLLLKNDVAPAMILKEFQEFILPAGNMSTDAIDDTSVSSLPSNLVTEQLQLSASPLRPIIPAALLQTLPKLQFWMMVLPSTLLRKVLLLQTLLKLCF